MIKHFLCYCAFKYLCDIDHESDAKIKLRSFASAHSKNAKHSTDRTYTPGDTVH